MRFGDSSALLILNKGGLFIVFFSVHHLRIERQTQQVRNKQTCTHMDLIQGQIEDPLALLEKSVMCTAICNDFS